MFPRCKCATGTTQTQRQQQQQLQSQQQQQRSTPERANWRTLERDNGTLTSEATHQVASKSDIDTRNSSCPGCSGSGSAITCVSENASEKKKKLPRAPTLRGDSTSFRTYTYIHIHTVSLPTYSFPICVLNVSLAHPAKKYIWSRS